MRKLIPVLVYEESIDYIDAYNVGQTFADQLRYFINNVRFNGWEPEDIDSISKEECRAWFDGCKSAHKKARRAKK